VALRPTFVPLSNNRRPLGSPPSLRVNCIRQLNRSLVGLNPAEINQPARTAGPPGIPSVHQAQKYKQGKVIAP
jgi:hypothetical protein